MITFKRELQRIFDNAISMEQDDNKVFMTLRNGEAVAIIVRLDILFSRRITVTIDGHKWIEGPLDTPSLVLLQDALTNYGMEAVLTRQTERDAAMADIASKMACYDVDNLDDGACSCSNTRGIGGGRTECIDCGAMADTLPEEC